MPAPFGPDQAEAVAAHDAQVEIAHDGAVAETLADVPQFGDELAGALARIDRQLDVAEPLAPRLAFASQLLQPLDAALVARAPRLDALADPDFFLRPELVELAVRHGLVGELFRLAPFVGGEVARIRAQQAAVEFDDARRDAVEERAVVRDDDGGGPVEQQLLEPLDAVDVEVIGRLVEQQQLRFQRERRRERRTLALAAGQSATAPPRHRGRTDAGIRPAAPRRASARVRHRARRARPCGRASRTVDPARQLGFLRDRAMRRPAGCLQVAIVQRDAAGDDVEQRRLAGAVAADQADALAGLEAEFGAIEQRLGAEGEFGAQQREQGHDGHS